MNIPKFTVNLRCHFCGSVLEGPEDAEYHSGDLIKCTKCGEDNDYDSVLEVAKKEGIKKAKGAVQEQLQKQFNGLFKKS
jgi:phage FluMu protein Com